MESWEISSICIAMIDLQKLSQLSKSYVEGSFLLRPATAINPQRVFGEIGIVALLVTFSNF